MTEWIDLGQQEPPMSVPLPRVFRHGPRTPTARRARARRSPAPQMHRLSEWHQMSPGERHVAWSQLRAWVTWLYDRYELSVEDRLPRCWPQHPGLVEELWALKAWREEIYQASQPSGQAARYWHAELRQVIQAATSFYAAGCRTKHRGARHLADDDARLQQRWAAASPLIGIPTSYLAHSQPSDGPDHWLSPAAMAEALDNGSAQALGTVLPDHICCAGEWWRPAASGWVRITDRGLTARLDSWARRMARADAQAAQRLTGRSRPDDCTGDPTEAPASGHPTPAPPA